MLHNGTVNKQNSVTTTTLTAFDIETSITEQPEAVSAQQVYKQSLEKIWENVSQLPEGQNTVVLSQLWALGKTATCLECIRICAAKRGYVPIQPTSTHLRNVQLTTT